MPWLLPSRTLADLSRQISFRGTKANIEADSAPIEESKFAFATDTSEIGIYTGGVWVWIGGGGVPGTGLEYKIYLWDSDLSTVTAYDLNNLQGALDDAESGDTVFVPDGTYTQNITIPANVSIKGLSRSFCIIIGTVTMGSGSTLQEISVKPSGNSANPINGIVVQASGISEVIQCDVIPVNAGAGGVNALFSDSDGTEITVKESLLDGRSVAIGTTGYAAFHEIGSSGKVFIHNSICLGSSADDPFNV